MPGIGLANRTDRTFTKLMGRAGDLERRPIRVDAAEMADVTAD